MVGRRRKTFRKEHSPVTEVGRFSCGLYVPGERCVWFLTDASKAGSLEQGEHLSASMMMIMGCSAPLRDVSAMTCPRLYPSKGNVSRGRWIMEWNVIVSCQPTFFKK